MSEHPHTAPCNYWTGPIGGPGCICEVVNKHEAAALREEVERLRSLVTRALILAGGYSTEQRRFWNELIREAEAVIKKDG